MRRNQKLVALFMVMMMLSLCLVGCGKEAKQEMESPGVQTIVDMADREVEVPDKIEKVFCVSPVGTILVYTLDPDLLIGWNYDLREGEKEFILPEYHQLPNLGGWYAKATCNTEELLKLDPDVILSVGQVDLEQAETVQEQTGIPVVIIKAEQLKDFDKAYEFAGKLLNKEEKAKELADYCRKTISEIEEKAKDIPEDQRVRVYYAEGPDGLQTDPAGSPHTETLDLVGGLNVAEVPMKGGMGMAEVSMEQVLSWNPDVILSWGKSQGGYYDQIFSDPAWQNLSAVSNKKVYAIPTGPFNWFDRPPSANRIIGVKWLGNLLYPDIYNYDMVKETKEFYKLFYHYDITDEEIETLLKDCGGI
ncbi:MAG TPA: ABC transporter substrate-binding protein [Syntrophomonadaceae bacterium]|nr:ABC transporter substrate-binding protein [Syntrophomonadaceae bacterium]